LGKNADIENLFDSSYGTAEFFVRSNQSTSEYPVFILFGISLEVGLISIKQRIIKVSLAHAAPSCAGSGAGPGHFGFYVRTLSLHFCKILFSGLE
jgi:hypothetical protein